MRESGCEENASFLNVRALNSFEGAKNRFAVKLYVFIDFFECYFFTNNLTRWADGSIMLAFHLETFNCGGY